MRRRRPTTPREDRFTYRPGGLGGSLCLSCQHTLPGGAWCAAFPPPGEIPQAILLNTFDHRIPYPGDQGIQYEQRTEEDEP